MTVAIGLPLLSLAQDEQDTLTRLITAMSVESNLLTVPDAYYSGTQLMNTLGISIPPQMAALRAVIGWPGLAIDSIEERLDVEGFRLNGATGADDDLWQIWQSNNLDEESPLAHLDALIFGRSYAAVGSPPTPGDAPLITVESARSTSILWNPQQRVARAALMYTDAYRPDGTLELNRTNAATATTALLFFPDQTISLTRNPGGQWGIVDRDQHNLGVVPVVRLANRQRAADRSGRSDITPAIMSITDAACRTLLGLEVSREFYSAPQRYILGAKESDFQDSAGNPKNAWETYLGRMMALTRDEDGNLPTVGSFEAGNPSNYTDIIDMYAKIMSALTSLPAHFLGYTTENPASADAIRSSESRLVKRIERKQQAFSGAWEQVMRLALLIRDGDVTDEAKRMETLWVDPATPTLAATTDALVKAVQSGIIPARSDVVLSKLGFTPAERAQLVADGIREDASGAIASLGQMAAARVLAAQETASATGAPITPGTDSGADASDPTQIGQGGAVHAPIAPAVK